MKKKIRFFLVSASLAALLAVLLVAALWLRTGEQGPSLYSLLPLLGLAAVFLAALSAAAADAYTKKLMRPYSDMLKAIENAGRSPDGAGREISAEYEELEPIAACFRQLLAQLSAAAAQSTAKTADIEAMLTSMDDGFVMLDAGFRILLINRRGQDFLGVPENAHRRNVTHYYRGGSFHEALLAVMLGDKRRVLDAPVSGGRTGRFFITSARERGITVIISDVTETLRLEKIRSEFAANASHELKTPLTSISGFAELLSTGMVSEPASVKAYAEKIMSETKRLTALADDLLRLATLESERDRQTERVNLRELFEYVAGLLAEPMAQKQVGYEILGDGALTAPRDPLLHIAVNLFENAVKYNRDGGRVTVELFPEGFSVADTGIGIPPEHLDRVFERFYRVDRARSRKTGGTGLGLAIVKHAAESLGARVEVQSGESGTTFSVVFREQRTE